MAIDWRHVERAYVYKTTEGTFGNLPTLVQFAADGLQRYTDRYGILPIGGDDPVDAVCRRVGADRSARRLLREAIPLLIEDGYLQLAPGALVVRNYLQARYCDDAETLARMQAERQVALAKCARLAEQDRRRAEARQQRPGLRLVVADDPRSPRAPRARAPRTNHEPTTNAPRNKSNVRQTIGGDYSTDEESYNSTVSFPPADHERATNRPRTDHERATTDTQCIGNHSGLSGCPVRSGPENEETLSPAWENDPSARAGGSLYPSGARTHTRGHRRTDDRAGDGPTDTEAAGESPPRIVPQRAADGSRMPRAGSRERPGALDPLEIVRALSEAGGEHFSGGGAWENRLRLRDVAADNGWTLDDLRRGMARLVSHPPRHWQGGCWTIRALLGLCDDGSILESAIADARRAVGGSSAALRDRYVATRRAEREAEQQQSSAQPPPASDATTTTTTTTTAPTVVSPGAALAERRAGLAQAWKLTKPPSDPCFAQRGGGGGASGREGGRT